MLNNTPEQIIAESAKKFEKMNVGDQYLDALHVAIKYGVDIDGLSALEYGILNNRLVEIEGVEYSVLEIAAKTKSKIKEQPALDFALDNGIEYMPPDNKNNIIAFAYAHDVGIKKQNPIEYAIKNGHNIVINGEAIEAIKFAEDRGEKFDKKHTPQVQSTEVNTDLRNLLSKKNTNPVKYITKKAAKNSHYTGI